MQTAHLTVGPAFRSCGDAGPTDPASQEYPHAVRSTVTPAPPSATSPSLPVPFSRLSRFDGFCEAVEPLAAEFWAGRQPLKAALVALERGWGNPAGHAACCLVAGDALRESGLSAFPSKQANAVELDAAPTPEQVVESWRPSVGERRRASASLMLAHHRRPPRMGISRAEGGAALLDCPPARCVRHSPQGITP